MTHHFKSYQQKQYFKKCCALVLCAALVCAITILFSFQKADAASLKSQSIVTEDMIRLGDLFYNLDSKKEKVLGPAPRPGQEMVLNARTLLRIALAMDLSWRPNSSYDQVVLRRDATLIDYDMIRDGLREELAEKNIEGLFDISFSRELSEIALPPEMPASYEISRLSVNHGRDTFSARISAPSTDNAAQVREIRGSIKRMAEVPVLKSAMRNGHVVRGRDIDMVMIPVRNLNEDTMLRKDDLLGMTPRRIIHAGKPISIKELQAPQIISRGQTVTVTFESGSILLTASGRALENGAKGDVIRVVNSESSRTIDVVITGENEVRVQTF